jgi:ATP-dependent DNA helicase RecG
MNIESLLDALQLGEDQEIEFKIAQGGFPKSSWETVSAFANTEGGTIILGVKEHDEIFTIEGIKKPKPLIKAFWDTHNNPQKLSSPVCRDADISTLTIEGKTVICIHVPRASRKQTPVFINGNPLAGSFKRNNEGDYRLSDSEYQFMMRDAGDEPLDSQIIDNFTLDDLDKDAINAYRNRFAARTPDHPFLAKSGIKFLECLGGWRCDRHRKVEGITLAALLMFGKERSLLEALPYFHLDYQEQISNDPDIRWTGRITIDGTWVPNLFNFYYRVYPKLVEDIDVPFNLDKTATRQDETPVHDAMREVLVNTLIHADHQSNRPIKILKQRKVFVFFNPGRLRISREQLYKGGVSDPRNPNLQKMFQMLGLGEKAGSGFQKILRAWHEQQWFAPLVSENLELEMTTVQMPLVSMIPETVEKELRVVVGDAYSTLDELGRMILLLTHSLGEIRNADIQRYLGNHPQDIGQRLRQLTASGWLNKDGHGRGTRYCLCKVNSDPVKTVSSVSSPNSEHLPLSSEHLPSSSEHLPSSSEHLPSSSEHLPSHDADMISSEINHSAAEERSRLLEIAAPIRDTRKINKTIMENVILALCEDEWLTLRTLTELLNRHSDTLRTHYINSMLQDGRLEARVPGSPNHPAQAYRKK